MYIRTPGICIYLEREGYSFFFAPLPFLSFFFFSCIQIQTKRKKKKRNGKRVQSKEGNREWASARGMNRRKRECGYRTEKEIEWKVSKLLIYLRLIRSHVVKNALQLSLLVRLFIKLCRLNTFILAGFLFFVCVYVYIYSLSLSLSLLCVFAYLYIWFDYNHLIFSVCCVSCFQTTGNIHNFCEVGLKIAGIVPIYSPPALTYSRTLLTSVAVSATEQHTVAFLGTSDGHLKKV